MGKYDPLAQYLTGLENESWDAGFADIERVLGFTLPDSAYNYPAWWANQDGHHSQTRGWREAGWETSQVDLQRRRVRFIRRKQNKRDANGGGVAGRTRLRGSLENLLDQAKTLSGIADRDELLEAALTQFIRQESARQLIALGGSDPTATASPRRRFW